jgi:nucleoside-diphosphate-sugar epimerase
MSKSILVTGATGFIGSHLLPTLEQINYQIRFTPSLRDRLLGSLQVDRSKIRETLNWQPPYTVDEGLKVTADWFSKTIKNENRSTFLPNIYQSTEFNSRIIARYS